MFAFSTQLNSNFRDAVGRHGASAAAYGAKSPVLQKEAHRWAMHFVSKLVDRNSGELVPSVAGKDPIYLTEIWLRHVRLNLRRILHTAGAAAMPSIDAVRARGTLGDRHALGSFYPREERFRTFPVTMLLPDGFRKIATIGSPCCPLWDITSARLFFSKTTPVPEETTWELYKRFDPSGARQMHQGQFYSLLPRSWRKMQDYQRVDATYADCLAAEVWFKETTPNKTETTWELYKRLDPSGARQMNQGHFYSLLPRSWRGMQNYQKVDATYADCLAAEVWFKEATPNPTETTWELYKHFDPSGTRRMHQGQFYSLLPHRWREMQNYQTVNATYADCLAAEVWFKKATPNPTETTWELYKRFDPSGARRMHQGQFYCLLPRSWRKMQNYQKMDATYADCLATEVWFKKATPIGTETTWQLYKRFDPNGTRRMHQGQFYSLLPPSWRETQNYQMVNTTYADCLTAEVWFKETTPNKAETTWELYKRLDPSGARQMNQGHFHSLLRLHWGKEGSYKRSNATHANCVAAQI